MGIGSIFASIFGKESDKKKEQRTVKEVKVDVVEKKRESTVTAKEESALMAEEKEVCEKENTVMPESNVEDTAAAVQELDEEKRERQAFYSAKRELYQYLNETLKALYEAYQNDVWEQVHTICEPSDCILTYYNRIVERLPQEEADMLTGLFGAVDLAHPQDGRLTVTDSEALKQVYLSMMLPFYPVYYKEFDELRFQTLLNRVVLDLFRRLTGRKYRLGYRNRYSTGVNAFEWKGDQYKVFAKDGRLLCDAQFENGAVKNGYAVSRQEGNGDPDWEILQKGTFVEGRFTEGTLEYVYKKAVK